MPDAASETLELTAGIVSSYVSLNPVDSQDLPALLRTVWLALPTLGKADAVAKASKPAVDITKSVYPDFIVCLEDGKRFTMLKRHLMTRYNMTPEQYRAKWQLPASYPPVAPNYAKRRSDLAKQSGLGRSRAVQAKLPQTAKHRKKG